MITGYKSIEDYDVDRPEFGTYSLDFDPHQFLSEAHTVYDSPTAKTSGRNNFNRFNNVSPDTKKWLRTYWNNQLGIDYDWNWEYFHSGEPAGLHTDYLSFPNSWKPNKDKITHDCFVVLGIIIPLEWNCKQPYTVNYDIVSDEPRKLMYRQGEMRYLDNNSVYDYRSHWDYDPEVLKYNPKETQYHKEYADLKFHSAYEWDLGICIVFDTRRWHSSSWFLSDERMPDVSTEYKRSIIGFASIDVDR
jgi:hypothetical protein